MLMAAVAVGLARFASAEDVSQPAMLQMFEAKWQTIEDRMPDIFQSGYGQMWLPPPERADTGSLSVGYDLFNRFDLGCAAERNALRHRDLAQSLRLPRHTLPASSRTQT